jgi:hypothetical protein
VWVISFGILWLLEIIDERNDRDLAVGTWVIGGRNRLFSRAKTCNL